MNIKTYHVLIRGRVPKWARIDFLKSKSDNVSGFAGLTFSFENCHLKLILSLSNQFSLMQAVIKI